MIKPIFRPFSFVSFVFFLFLFVFFFFVPVSLHLLFSAPSETWTVGPTFSLSASSLIIFICFCLFFIRQSVLFFAPFSFHFGPSSLCLFLLLYLDLNLVFPLHLLSFLCMFLLVLYSAIELLENMQLEFFDKVNLLKLDFPLTSFPMGKMRKKNRAFRLFNLQ